MYSHDPGCNSARMEFLLIFGIEPKSRILWRVDFSSDQYPDVAMNGSLPTVSLPIGQKVSPFPLDRPSKAVLGDFQLFKCVCLPEIYFLCIK